MQTIASAKNEYARPQVVVLIFGRDVMTADVLSSSTEGAYQPDKEWKLWEDVK